MKAKDKIIYYSDELNDDFSGATIKNTATIDESYKYIRRGVFWRIAEFIVYRLIAIPAVYLFCRIGFCMRVKNRKVIRPYRRSGFFMYGNHTQNAADAFIPSIVSFPKKSYIIVNPDAVSIKGLRSIVQMLGAIPLASNVTAARNFSDAIKERYEQKHCVAVYPEAHIWPYYTGIRPFRSNSFRYPARLNAPVFCFTSTYQKRRLSRRPRITVYVDGPFLADDTMSLKAGERYLRDRVYSAMLGNAERYSDYRYIQYEKVEENEAV